MILRRAFTLVELLVVIGIIAVLIAILLPALRAAREHALSVQCLSNLRNAGQVFHMYAGANRGFFPQMVWDTPENFPRAASMIPASSGLPPEARDYPDIASATYRLVNPGRNLTDIPYTAGGMMIFYCPSNYLHDHQPRGSATLSRWPEDFQITGKIRYWYFGNPNPYYPNFHFMGPFGSVLPGSPPATAPNNGTIDWRFWDTNRNGDNRDEYLIKNSDKNAAEKVLMTDQGRQLGFVPTTSFGFAFVHGKKQGVAVSGWRNALYGDGHADSRRPRTSSFNPAGTAYINPNPEKDEVQPRWGNANQYMLW